MAIGGRKTGQHVPVIEGLPINVNLYGASQFVVDLGDPYPEEIIVQSDLGTNSTYRIGLLVNSASSSIVGTDFAAACTGLGFTLANQPANDGVEMVSDVAGDTARTVTIYGTITGTNIVQTSTKTVNGTTPVSFDYTNWGFILGVEASAAHATAVITLRDATGDGTFTTIAATETSTGVTAVAAGSEQCYGLPVRAVASAATTKVVGIVGTNPVGTAVYDAITLAGTTAVTGVVGMYTVTKLLHGDVEAARTATFDIGNLTPGASAARIASLGAAQGTVAGAFDPRHGRRLPNGGRYLHICLANGMTLATGGAADWLHIEVWR